MKIDIYVPIIMNGKKTNYLISDTGKIKNKITGAILSQQISKAGYYQVHLSINGKSKHYLVHRLVATHHILNPEKKLTVNHIDGDKLNNDVRNLEWATHHEQNIHALQIGLYDNNRGEKSHLATITNSDVHAACKMMEDGYSIPKISNMLSISKPILYHILYGDSWKEISAQYMISHVCRDTSGSNNYNSKLTEKDVFNILDLYNSGKYPEDIRNELSLNVSRSCIQDICTERRRKKQYNAYINSIRSKERSTTIEKQFDKIYIDI